MHFTPQKLKIVSEKDTMQPTAKSDSDHGEFVDSRKDIDRKTVLHECGVLVADEEAESSGEIHRSEHQWADAKAPKKGSADEGRTGPSNPLLLESSICPPSLQRASGRPMSTSSPGAYACPGPAAATAAPGGGVVTAVGSGDAVAVEISEVLTHTGEAEPLLAVGVPTTNPSISPPAGVAVAELVEDDGTCGESYDLEMQHAKEVNLEEKKLALHAGRRRFVHKVIAMITCLALTAVVISAVTLTRAETTNDDAIDVIEEDEQATDPQVISTSEPISVEKQIKALLPRSTIFDIEARPESPQHKAFQWLLQDLQMQSKAYSERRILQRYALAALYYSTNGDEWLKRENWLSYECHECDWYAYHSSGIYEVPETQENLMYNETSGPCGPDYIYGLYHTSDPLLGDSSLLQQDGYGTFQHLWLLSNNLQGELPDELYLLSSLRSISLDRNNLKGTISPLLGNLQNLEALALYTNKLTGSIPSEIGLLSDKLAFVWLMNNQISGQIPTEIGQLSNSLEYLILDTNQLTGILPTELGRLSRLSWFWLWANNQMSGTIPTEIGLMKSLSSLAIDWLNAFTGTIPTEIGMATSLCKVHLGDLLLTGPIPTEMGQLTALTSLMLQNNRMTGAIPTEIGMATSLCKVHLGDLLLTGPIPTEMGQLTALTSLMLQNNRMTGAIPTELGLLSGMDFLGLWNTFLTGSISSELGALSLLRTLWIWNDIQSSLTGSIPTEFGNLEALTSLSMDNNLLTGTLPSQLGLLSNVGALLLSGNSLSGTIPSEFGLLQQLDRIDLSSNALSGSIPSELGGLDKALISRVAIDEEAGSNVTYYFAILTQIIFHNNLLTGFVPAEPGVFGGIFSQ